MGNHFGLKFSFMVEKNLLDLDAIEWAKKVEGLGAGEILLTSIDKDGTKDGYDVILTSKIVNSLSIPVIASGGCGEPKHMVEVFDPIKC